MLYTILVIVFVAILLMIISLRKALKEDLKELSTNPIDVKFKIVCNTINESCFENLGEIQVVDNRTFTLYKNNNSYKEYFRFEYSSGHLSIFWTVYSNMLGKSVLKFKKNFRFNNVRNISDIEQKEIGDAVFEYTDQQIQIEYSKTY